MRLILVSFISLAACGAWLGSARADDWSECRNGNPSERIATCTKIIAAEKTDTRRKGAAFNNRGWGYNDKSEFDKAILDLNESLRISPRDPIALTNRGYSHFQRTDYGLAKSDFDAAIEIRPNYASAYVLRGRVAQALHQYDRAIVDHSEAIRIDPAYLNAYGQRASS